jgi:hypothetical protein
VKIAVRSALVVFLAIASASFTVSAAHASGTAVTLYVDATSTFDGSDCSAPAPCPDLTDALTEAAGLAGDSVTIQVAPGDYPESVTIAPPSGGSLLVQGPGAGSATIIGAAGEPVVTVAGPAVVDSLAITGGSTGVSIAAAAGTVTLSNDWIHANQSTSAGAAGVDVTAGSVAVEDDTLSDNVAGSGAAGLGLATGTSGQVDDSTFAANTGAAIANAGTLSMTGSTLRDNVTSAKASEGITGPGTTSVGQSILSDSACTSSVVDLGYNVADDNSCGFGASSLSNSATIDFTGPADSTPTEDADDSVGPPVQPIDSTSSAFLEVPSASCSGTDERGFPRPGFGVTGAGCAAGAFEPQRTSVLDQAAPTSALVATDASTITLQMTTPATFSAAPSSVPNGVTVSPAGVVAVSAATTPGNYVLGGFAYAASGNSLAVGTWTLNLRAVAVPAITTTSLPSGVNGVAYRLVLTATGGVAPYTWTISSGSLPDGLALSPDGIITGTPTTDGTSTLTLHLADSSSPAFTASATFTMSVVDILVSPTTLADGRVDVAYKATLASTGGSGTKTWKLTAGALPAGLKLASSGAISGTPTVVGTGSFTVTVTDSSKPVKTGTAVITVTIDPMMVATASLPAGLIDKAYTSTTLKTTGGKSAFVWTLIGGSLPTGMKLATSGALSGTPTVAGTFTPTFSVHDSSKPAYTASATLSLVIDPMSVSTTTLAAATVGKAYSASLKAVGGKTPYVWTLSAGSLPTGVKLSTAGAFSGTPTVAGSYSFAVRVTDKSVPANTATAQLTITVG